MHRHRCAAPTQAPHRPPAVLRPTAKKGSPNLRAACATCLLGRHLAALSPAEVEQIEEQHVDREQRVLRPDAAQSGGALSGDERSGEALSGDERS
eukprot:6179900-Pleurochrysis_carterae.AAC.3